MVEQVTRTGFTRVFIMEGLSGPDTPPVYQGFMKANGFTWDQGDVSIVRRPSDSQYDAFESIGKIIGAPGNPEIELMAFYPPERLSLLFRLARNNCDNDVQIHIGTCQDPRDFDGGWSKILVLEKARATSYSTEDLGALEPDDRANIHETLPITAEDAYEVVRVNLAELAATQFTREAMDVSICDAVTCGACGLPSDGTNKVFALENFAAGSPGVNAQVVATSDGGRTFVESTINSLGAAQTANRLACVGRYLVVVSDASDSLHYALVTDVLRGVGGSGWTQNSSGFVATKGPRDVFSIGSNFTWFVGEGGYIYFANDPTSTVTPQESGSLTVGNLNAIHGLSDGFNLVTVGDGNIVLFTTNGGATWAAAPGGGPAPGVALNAVFMRSDAEWWVGTATGRLFYTRDAGTSWREKAFPGSGSGAVRDIKFSTRQVGYLAHDVTGGRILRTVNGGQTWYVTPEGTGLIPTNLRINQLAVSDENVNIVFGAGIKANNDGILIKGAGV
jgi:photosystem II stability/assembly factor-like uncharacterized protein